MDKIKILEYVNKNLQSQKLLEFDGQSKCTRIWRQLFERDGYSLILNSDHTKLGYKKIGKKVFHAIIVAYSNRVAINRAIASEIISHGFEYNDVMFIDDTNITEDTEVFKHLEKQETQRRARWERASWAGQSEYGAWLQREGTGLFNVSQVPEPEINPEPPRQYTRVEPLMYGTPITDPNLRIR